MSDIAKAMENKGYTPLTANRFCAIGLRSAMAGKDARPASRKWFYNNTFMEDGTPIAIAARSDVEEQDFLKRGFRVVELGASKACAPNARVERKRR